MNNRRERELTLLFKLGFIGLGVLAVCAVSVAAYLLGLHQALEMHDAGFTPWSGSMLVSDIGPDAFNSPGSSVWYRYAPGAMLQFAFIYAPELRALIAGTAMGLAAVLACWLALRRPGWLGFLKIPAGLCILLCVPISFVPLVVQPPSSFGVDLHSALLTDDALAPGDTADLASVTGFAEDYVPGRVAGAHSVIYANRKDGSEFVLVEMNGGQEAAALLGEVERFVKTGGQSM